LPWWKSFISRVQRAGNRLVGASAALRDDPERLARLVGIVEAAPAR
jgi:hypothetical protein